LKLFSTSSGYNSVITACWTKKMCFSVKLMISISSTAIISVVNTSNLARLWAIIIAVHITKLQFKED